MDIVKHRLQTLLLMDAPVEELADQLDPLQIPALRNSLKVAIHTSPQQ